MNQQVKGIWQGLLVGAVLEIFMYYYVLVYRVNWDKLAVKISQKMQEKNQKST